VFACSLARNGVIDERQSMIRIIVDKGIVIDIAVCRHCDPAPCVNVCEFDALRVENGRIILDQSKCTTCKACISVCPFGAIRKSYGGELVKCDLCDGDPACVRVCPTGAIKYIPAHFVKTRRTSSVTKTIYEYVEKIGMR
ncbi:MAG: 4Fe-4S binding protein, partial [Staphylothermus sp.]|nr:4Fe-4S binding protein [Staphylothermus sp.]